MTAAWLLAGALASTALPPVMAREPAPKASAKTAVEYDIAFPRPEHHEAQISVTYRGLGRTPIRFQMARSSPGRYALHEFAKNVYSVSAIDGAGRPLTISRTDPYGWTVPAHDGTVTVRYTLFGDRGDGTYAQIDPTHAHLNIPATFMWAAGQDDRPIRVRFHPAAGWKIATQLAPTDDPAVFTARDLQYFMDSPVEMSAWDIRSWTVGDGAQRYTIRLTAHHDGSPADLDRFAAMARKVVAQQIAVFGEAPPYDYGTYTFLADYMPQISGDGMEHRNSTVISMPQSLAAAKFAQIQTLSHEFFHAWNVERIRPAELEPFDFTRANATPSLWLAEGFTQYYGPLAVVRAEQMPLADYIAQLSATLNALLITPARRYGGPQEMSLRAPFVDAAQSIDPTNPNIFKSYYPYGAVLALALDLQLRQAFPKLTLDDYMRQLWRNHGKTERSYRPDDLRIALAELTGDQGFADRFFTQYVIGSALPDFAPLLAQAGLTLRPVHPDAAWAGGTPAKGDDGMTIVAPTAPGTPLYDAGLDKGDVIVSIDGRPVADAAAWTALLAAHKPGDRLSIVYRQRGGERRATMILVADPNQEILLDESLGQSPTPRQMRFRQAWLGPRPLVGRIGPVTSAP
ncbi:PDZ domain-containing protein [Sphingomonas sanguinis]|uniref:M61 family metallopeptidase n=1 Tax=Sphingomonas sp. LC-1 TaxID=3110957 RepID=UPI0021BAA951|nr:PDZ domain-containing protein [Sphingomonas sp. LC-1]MCT8003083.1 PDZ domain-containing protein [Sphingomonas sp. LC-1]